MRKIINISANERVIIDVNDDTFEMVISKEYIKDNKVVKYIRFTMDFDYKIESFYEENDANCIQFIFEYNDPLYEYLNNFLDEREKIILDDDKENDDLIKYVEFKRDEKKIIVIFNNKSFIKNKDISIYKYADSTKSKNSSKSIDSLKLFRLYKEMYTHLLDIPEFEASFSEEDILKII